MNRNGDKIRAWMVERRISVSSVARTAGVTQSIVSETIHGKRNNRRASGPWWLLDVRRSCWRCRKT